MPSAAGGSGGCVGGVAAEGVVGSSGVSMGLRVVVLGAAAALSVKIQPVKGDAGPCTIEIHSRRATQPFATLQTGTLAVQERLKTSLAAVHNALDYPVYNYVSTEPL